MAEEISLEGVSENLLLGKLFQLLYVPSRIGTREYAETYRWLSSEVTSKPGKMDCSFTPHMLFVMECFDNPDIPIIVGRKSAQIAWTETTNSYISRIIDLSPRAIIIAFPRLATGKAYCNEKFRPMVRANPRLLEKIGDPDKCSFDFFKFPGGFFKIVTAASPTALKSTSAGLLLVEEPDDLKEDIKGQGDALKIFMQRGKTFADFKLIFGGTPSEEGFSKVDIAFGQSNQMFYKVPCRKCGQRHVMSFKNLLCDKFSDGSIHPTWGRYNPRTARYLCPNCRAEWDNQDRYWAVDEAVNFTNKGWEATAESEIYGFAFNELLSKAPGSTHEALASAKLEAEVDAEKGKEGKLKSFVNNSEGLSYSSRAASLTEKELKSKRLDYPEMVVPVGGLVITAGIDVQHNRFAITLRARGRNGNSWLVCFLEIFGRVTDKADPVWTQLTEFVISPVPHESSSEENPIELPITAISIDSSDGTTTQLVYDWVASMKNYNKYVFAVKGSSDTGAVKKEIFTVPQDPDSETEKSRRKKSLETHGNNVFIVGTHSAKDEIYRRLALDGKVDRMYHSVETRDDWESQILSNRKKFEQGSRSSRYELISGKTDEALDTEVYSLHAAHAIYVHLWQEKQWATIEASLIAKTITTKARRQKITSGIN